MKLTSPAFNNNQTIPERFTCRGEDINPRLEIRDVPEATKSLCMVMHDPDSVKGDFVHWVAYNIKPTNAIPESDKTGTAGRNDFGRLGYGGPCPQSGTHRYVMELFALNSTLELSEGARREEVEQTMRGHVLASAQLTGRVAARHEEPQTH